MSFYDLPAIDERDPYSLGMIVWVPGIIKDDIEKSPVVHINQDGEAEVKKIGHYIADDKVAKLGSFITETTQS